MNIKIQRSNYPQDIFMEMEKYADKCHEQLPLHDQYKYFKTSRQRIKHTEQLHYLAYGKS